MTFTEQMAEAYEHERQFWAIRDNKPQDRRYEVIRIGELESEEEIKISSQHITLNDAEQALTRERAIACMKAAFTRVLNLEMKQWLK